VVTYGLGQDIWMLSADEISNVLFYFFIEEFLYTFQVVFTKISIILLYLRIFPKDSFRIQCWVLIGTTAAFGVSCVLSALLLCRPISYNWTSWDGQHPGSCGNNNAQIYTMAAVNIFLDLVTFFLPIPPL
jgi:hypothetical protein